ncbi:hypothetical protein ACTJJH_15540 [Acinetobacter sp. 22301]|uniref:hypothetical protein n=1 Tax=Acinetobacter sp. 22301 TaxID=3453904 RepID=UPI003F84F8E8
MKSIHYLNVSPHDLDKVQSLLLLRISAGKANTTIGPEKEREIKDLFFKIFEENNVKYNGDNFSLDKIGCSLNFKENIIEVTSDDMIKL